METLNTFLKVSQTIWHIFIDVIFKSIGTTFSNDSTMNCNTKNTVIVIIFKQTLNILRSNSHSMLKILKHEESTIYVDYLHYYQNYSIYPIICHNRCTYCTQGYHYVFTLEAPEGKQGAPCVAKHYKHCMFWTKVAGTKLEVGSEKCLLPPHFDKPGTVSIRCPKVLDHVPEHLLSKYQYIKVLYLF